MKSFFTNLGKALLCGAVVAMIGCTDLHSDIKLVETTNNEALKELAAKLEADYATKQALAAAQEAGAATLNYGLFIQAVIDFIITAFVIFLLVKGINKIRSLGKKEEEVVEAAPTTKVCPFCKSEISIDATRCAHCTSEVE